MTTPFVQRVEVGAYYTDGDALWQVVEVSQLGAVELRSGVFDEHGRTVGIDAFRRRYWLVRSARKVDAPSEEVA